jgi:hypothetical protein
MESSAILSGLTPVHELSRRGASHDRREPQQAAFGDSRERRARSGEEAWGIPPPGWKWRGGLGDTSPRLEVERGIGGYLPRESACSAMRSSLKQGLSRARTGCSVETNGVRWRGGLGDTSPRLDVQNYRGDCRDPRSALSKRRSAERLLRHAKQVGFTARTEFFREIGVRWGGGLGDTSPREDVQNYRGDCRDPRSALSKRRSAERLLRHSKQVLVHPEEFESPTF